MIEEAQRIALGVGIVAVLMIALGTWWKDK
jgi:hypothetical protein